MIATLICTLVAAVASAQAGPLVLWYSQPAEEWIEALPVGNGRLGALVFGRPQYELIQLNEDTIWTGGPYDSSNPKGGEAIEEIRRLILEGKEADAQALFGKTMMAQPGGEQMKYQPLGDVRLSFRGQLGVSEYRRELDLDTAIVRVSYRVGDVKYAREVFVSPVDQVIVVRMSADKPGRITLKVELDGRNARKWPSTETYRVGSEKPSTLLLSGKTGRYR